MKQISIDGLSFKIPQNFIEVKTDSSVSPEIGVLTYKNYYQKGGKLIIIITVTEDVNYTCSSINTTINGIDGELEKNEDGFMFTFDYKGRMIIFASMDKSLYDIFLLKNE